MRVLVSFLNGWSAESLAKLIKPDKKLATDTSFSSIFNNSSEHELANSDLVDAETGASSTK